VQEKGTNILGFEKHQQKYGEFKNALLSLNEIVAWETFLLILKKG
jgi:hypothetical protein